LWTRDGAFVANALDLAGYSDAARRFYRFCAKVMHPHGYFLQKYNADGTVASGWHPCWNAQEQEPMVPIQEDETALVIWALWQHYERYRDIEFRTSPLPRARRARAQISCRTSGSARFSFRSRVGIFGKTGAGYIRSRVRLSSVD
jgi:hypothetical protein